VIAEVERISPITNKAKETLKPTGKNCFRTGGQKLLIEPLALPYFNKQHPQIY
jgi:hypothetical protein